MTEKQKLVQKHVEKKPSKDKSENPMRKFYLEKIILSCGAKDKELDKAQKLLQYISGKKATRNITQKRIPDFDVRPGLEVGTSVTLRGEEAVSLLKKLLASVDNKLQKSQVTSNSLSFGIHEYIEIPGVEYQREIGIRGLNVTISFARPGFRTKRKKIKYSKLPKKQNITEEEIINYMGDNFKTKFK
jgi:large subunit ribosomal protein L5